MAIKKWFLPNNNISINGSINLPGDKSIGIRSIIILSQCYEFPKFITFQMVKMFKQLLMLLKN